MEYILMWNSLSPLLICCRFVESCLSFFKSMFVCVDALCIFLPGIGRICWLEKGRKTTIKYKVIATYISFSAFISDETEITHWGGFGAGMHVLMWRWYTAFFFFFRLNDSIKILFYGRWVCWNVNRGEGSRNALEIK